MARKSRYIAYAKKVKNSSSKTKKREPLKAPGNYKGGKTNG